MKQENPGQPGWTLLNEDDVGWTEGNIKTTNVQDKSVSDPKNLIKNHTNLSNLDKKGVWEDI